MGQKLFFEFIEKVFINFFWICSTMKIYIICCAPTQIPYLGKFLFLRYGSKCSQPIRLQDFLINRISRRNEWNSLIFYILIQIHINQKLLKKFGGGHVQKCVWPAWLKDSKIDCISRMNWWNELIFACWCKFRKAKSNFNDFWVDVITRWAWPLSLQDPIICWMSLWIELIFCVLTVMQQFLGRPTLYSISLNFKCQFTAVLFIRPLAVARMILWNWSVHPCPLTSVWVSSWNWIIRFLWIFTWC